MTFEQYILSKIAEEASEIAKCALKAQQFGLDSYHPDDPKRTTNLVELIAEMNDLTAVMLMLEPTIGPSIQQHNVAQGRKMEKVHRYAGVVQSLGRLT